MDAVVVVVAAAVRWILFNAATFNRIDFPSVVIVCIYSCVCVFFHAFLSIFMNARIVLSWSISMFRNCRSLHKNRIVSVHPCCSSFHQEIHNLKLLIFFSLLLLIFCLFFESQSLDLSFDSFSRSHIVCISIYPSECILFKILYALIMCQLLQENQFFFRWIFSLLIDS